MQYNSSHGGLDPDVKDRLINGLHTWIRFSVRILAVLMAFVIFWGVLDVIWVLTQKLAAEPVFLLRLDDILETFGAFLAVLIAIEIFFNITLYLREDIIHVPLVIATALMAIARKVIVFDFAVLEPAYVFATAATVLSLGITYWLLVKKTD